MWVLSIKLSPFPCKTSTSPGSFPSLEFSAVELCSPVCQGMVDEASETMNFLYHPLLKVCVAFKHLKLCIHSLTVCVWVRAHICMHARAHAHMGTHALWCALRGQKTICGSPLLSCGSWGPNRPLGSAESTLTTEPSPSPPQEHLCLLP